MQYTARTRGASAEQQTVFATTTNGPRTSRAGHVAIPDGTALCKMHILQWSIACTDRGRGRGAVTAKQDRARTGARLQIMSCPRSLRRVPGRANSRLHAAQPLCKGILWFLKAVYGCQRVACRARGRASRSGGHTFSTPHTLPLGATHPAHASTCDAKFKPAHTYPCR